jgi:hypothetical protein
MIKADFWSDEKVGSVSLLSRLLFIGSWTIADDSGVCRAHSIFLKNQLFPYDEKITKKNIEDSLSELANAGLVSFIDYQGESYIYIGNFGKHQLINRPSEHRFIEIEADDYSTLIEQSVSNHGVVNGKVKVKEKVNVKENINHAKNECLKIWNERIGEFKIKYPELDYELQRDLILQWISDTPKKSLKKSNWNLFIQNWLSRSKRIYKPFDNHKGTGKNYPAHIVTNEELIANRKQRDAERLLKLPEIIERVKCLLNQYEESMKGEGLDPPSIKKMKALPEIIRELEEEQAALGTEEK